MYLNLSVQTHHMPARTQNSSQNVLTKLNPCQWRHKMYRNMCWPNPYLGNADTRCMWTSQQVLIKHLPCQRRHNMFWPNYFHAIEDTMYILTKYISLWVRTQNVSQLVLTKRLQCQRGHKMHLNMIWPNPSNASEDTKCISTCVDQNSPMSARTKNISELVLTKPISWLLGHKMYIKLCWPNPTHASENTKCFSACVDKNPPILMFKQNYFNMYRPTKSNAFEDTKCISTFVDQTPPMPSRTQNLS